MDTTILYLTHDGISTEVRDLCYRQLLRAADGIPIVEMHQPPEWEKSGLSMYRQIKLGLEKIDTRFVAIAEHDCLYTSEHFNFRPPDEEFFYYNTNCYLVQMPGSNQQHPEYDGMFSIFPGRRVQSQLICGTEPLRQVAEDQIRIVEDPAWNTRRYNRPVGEPGTMHWFKIKQIARESSSLQTKMRAFMMSYNAKDFQTKVPTIDIRHGDNFTGHRRGKNRTFNLEGWGTWKDIAML